MIPYPRVIVLGLFWVAVTGSASVPNLLFGLALGALCLHLVREHPGAAVKPGRFIRLVVLAVVFLREVVLSAWRVARLVLSPRMDLKPGIFAYPLSVQTDFEIALLANMITLTPGTLSVDVSSDRKLLYVHAMDCSDADAAIADIERIFERRILRAFH